MRFEAFIARRYLSGKRKNRFVSLITIISVAGVSVGVMALIVVMSVMTGFDQELMATFIGARADLQIYDPYMRPITSSETVAEEIRSLCPEVVACSPFIMVKSVLKRTRVQTGGDSALPAEELQAPHYEPALIMGIDVASDQQVTQLAEHLSRRKGRTMSAGRLPEKKHEAVIGYILADNLGAFLGDTVAAITLAKTPWPLGEIAAKPLYLTVCGISQAQMSDFDEVFTYVDLPTARMLKRWDANGDMVDGLHVKLTSPWAAQQVADRIERELGLDTVTWYESNQAFFEALVQEKVAMFIILLFIVLVAAFNITSTLIMIVMEKRRDIGILRTIGVSSGRVMLLFVIEGLYIGVGGTLLGLVGGTLLAYNLNPVAAFIARLLGVDLFNSVVYYFDHIPVAVVPRDVATIVLSAILLTLISTIYPAWSASRLDPVDALRYE